MDTDGNGEVSKEEALSFFRSKGYDVDPSWLDGAWDIMDKDQNGILDATEFLQMFDTVKTRASRACKVAGRVLESETERSSAAAEAVPPSHTENTRASLHVTNDADHIDIHYTCEVASFGASECLECSNQEVVLQMGSQESKAWKDKIVIFERGTMAFVAMALQAQESEAKAVVVINSDDESFVPGSGGEDTASVYVPIVCVSKSDGGKLKAAMLGSTNRDKMRATLQFSIAPESRARIQAFAMFNTLDVDASNTLDREEFEKLIGALLPNMDATEREQAFEEVDKDNSGAVDRSEFLLWWERIIKTHDEAQMELVRAEVQAEQAVARQASEMSANGMEELAKDIEDVQAEAAAAVAAMPAPEEAEDAAEDARSPAALPANAKDGADNGTDSEEGVPPMATP